MISEKERAYRAALAQQLRGPTPATAAGVNIYRQLIRNNLHNFLDRCFNRTLARLPAEQWADLKEAYLERGPAPSPFFTDIPGQFHEFLTQEKLLAPPLLAALDVERRELAAELGPDEALVRDVDDALPIYLQTGGSSPCGRQLRWSPAAQAPLSYRQVSASLVCYGWQVEGNLEPGECWSLVWRDHDDRVQRTVLSPAVAQLLAHFTAPQSLNGLLAALAEHLPGVESQRPALRQILLHWVRQGLFAAKLD